MVRGVGAIEWLELMVEREHTEGIPNVSDEVF